MSNVSKNEQTKLIHKKIVDIILASPLNIDSIPDDVEREMYESILDVLDQTQIIDKGCSLCWSKCFKCCYRNK